MSNWGVGLLFSPGPGGRPELLTIRDVEAACPTCGHPAVQRFYDAVPFHSWTLAACRIALERAGRGLHTRCTQCDTEVGEADIVRWVVHTGFARGRGLVQGFAAKSGERRWLLSPHQHLDVQLVPAWGERADASQREVEALTGAAVSDAFGRSFSPKEELRAWLRATPASTPALTRLAPGLWAASAPNAIDAEASLATLRATTTLGSWVRADLLAEGELDASAPHAAFAWLSGLGAALEGRAVATFASADLVAPTLDEVLARFPVQVPVELSGDTLVLQVPGFPEGALTVDPRDVAREAARSASAPADLARLELDRVLWAVTGWDATQDADP